MDNPFSQSPFYPVEEALMQAAAEGNFREARVVLRQQRLRAQELTQAGARLLQALEGIESSLEEADGEGATLGLARLREAHERLVLWLEPAEL